jgi:hypothetical protein
MIPHTALGIVWVVLLMKIVTVNLRVELVNQIIHVNVIRLLRVNFVGARIGDSNQKINYI